LQFYTSLYCTIIDANEKFINIFDTAGIKSDAPGLHSAKSGSAENLQITELKKETDEREKSDKPCSNW